MRKGQPDQLESLLDSSGYLLISYTLGILAHLLRMVIGPKYYAEKVIGHSLLIIWEIDWMPRVYRVSYRCLLSSRYLTGYLVFVISRHQCWFSPRRSRRLYCYLFFGGEISTEKSRQRMVVLWKWEVKQSHGDQIVDHSSPQMKSYSNKIHKHFYSLTQMLNVLSIYLHLGNFGGKCR